MKKLERRDSIINNFSLPPRGANIGVKLYFYFADKAVQINFTALIAVITALLIFDVPSNIKKAYDFTGALDYAYGRVTLVEPTFYGGEYTEIYEIEFTYEHPELGLLNAVCFGFNESPELGSDVTVEFVIGKPFRARISGYQAHNLNLVIYYILALFLGLSGTQIRFLYKRYKEILFLQFGYLSFAALIDKKFVRNDKNKISYYLYTVKFKDFSRIDRIFQFESELRDELDSQEQIPVIYLLEDEDRVVFLDEIHNEIYISANGTINFYDMFNNL
ncbi:MAG: hypothetical protein SCALA702_04620 [Melioribacteraceae bacterium]|nr:MAG: hypothetical protein SCALA702_04620 [Melioribacteraceae bacterium]